MDHEKLAMIQEYDSKGYTSAGAKHVSAALAIIEEQNERINELEQAAKCDEGRPGNDCDAVSSETVCYDQSDELKLVLDRITGIANGLTTGSVGSSKVKIIGAVKELKSKIFN